jgi:hypothetical protein
VRNKRGVDIGSDHRLIEVNFRIKVQAKQIKYEKTKRRYDVIKFKIVRRKNNLIYG